MGHEKIQKDFPAKGRRQKVKVDDGNSTGAEDKKSALQIFDYLGAFCLKPSLLVFATIYSSGSCLISLTILWVPVVSS